MATSAEEAGGSRPLRVGLFVARLATGGAERQIVQLAVGLARRGHRVSLWTLYPGGELEHDLAEAPDVRLDSLFKKKRTSRLHAAYDLLTAAPRLRKTLGNQAIDVIYSFLYPSSAIAGLAVGRRRDARWVLGVRSAGARLNWERALFFKLCAWLSPQAALLVANSHRGLKDHVARGFRASRSIVIPNGIDSQRFRPSEELRRRTRHKLKIPEEAVVIGRVGRLSPVKDYPTFLRAARSLKDRDPRAVFLCVGDGPKKNKRDLLALCRQLGLETSVIWTGTRSDIVALFNAMDIAVSNSLSEGFPNVVAEAMACGVPCVVTDVGDSALVVGDAGLVVPPSDPEALVGAIEILIATSPSGKECRHRIENAFSLETMTAATETALRELVH